MDSAKILQSVSGKRYAPVLDRLFIRGSCTNQLCPPQERDASLDAALTYERRSMAGCARAAELAGRFVCRRGVGS